MDRAKFSKFVGDHRLRFDAESSQAFGTSFAKVATIWAFLEIILGRYVEASNAVIENATALSEILEGGSPKDDTGEKLSNEAWPLSVRLHLEIESYYLFAKIMLDRIANSLEFYFGPGRDCSLNSHDGLTKCLQSYARLKDLKLPSGFADKVLNLKETISDFRDYKISHEPSPKTTHVTAWNNRGEGNARLVKTKLGPGPNNQIGESEDLLTLHSRVESYMEDVCAILIDNIERTRLKRGGRSSPVAT
jgi:hypothetical protein